MQIEDPQNVAHASIQSPPGVLGEESKQVDVFLRPTEDGRFRWFRADGTPTAVDGPTVENASRAAMIVWDTCQLDDQGAK